MQQRLVFNRCFSYVAFSRVKLVVFDNTGSETVNANGG